VTTPDDRDSDQDRAQDGDDPEHEGPSEPTPTVFVIGAGVVGTTLASRLLRTGVPVVGLHGRRSDLSQAASAASGVLSTSGELPATVSTCDVVVIAVRDTRIAEIAKRLGDENRLRKQQVVLHTSGSRPAAEVLGVARPLVAGVGTMHPLVAVTGAPGSVDNFQGAAFGIEGDAEAQRRARHLIRFMGGRALALDAGGMALYHAGAVVASNYVVALADLGRSLLVAAGVPEGEAGEALWPLMTSAVRNLAEIGLPGALTGPVARGDVVSVERHLQALGARTPQLVDLYKRLGREVLRLARKRSPDLDEAAAQKLAQLLG
jgi:predicted short-subunit dehydrogenase-like oxidoreductase (DUF2520 family)